MVFGWCLVKEKSCWVVYDEKYVKCEVRDKYIIFSKYVELLCEVGVGCIKRKIIDLNG